VSLEGSNIPFYCYCNFIPLVSIGRRAMDIADRVMNPKLRKRGNVQEMDKSQPPMNGAMTPDISEKVEATPTPEARMCDGKTSGV